MEKKATGVVGAGGGREETEGGLAVLVDGDRAEKLWAAKVRIVGCFTPLVSHAG